MRTPKVAIMSKRIAARLLLAVALAVLFAGATGWALPALAAQDASAVALSGVVSSPQEGLMEGVVVNARRDGANFTVSVVSDAHGKYSFPRTHLDPGKYALTIRAVGYDLIGPKSAEVAADKTATADLKLDKAKDLGSQLSSLEWAMSITGTPEQKDRFIYQTNNCAYCHRWERIMKSKYTADEFVDADHPHAELLLGRHRVQPRQPRARADRHARPGCRRTEESDVGPRRLRDTRRRIWPSTSPR